MGKSIYKVVPFEKFEPYKMEKWLDDWAEKGLQLKKTGALFARFEINSGTNIRYKIRPNEGRYDGLSELCPVTPRISVYSYEKKGGHQVDANGRIPEDAIRKEALRQLSAGAVFLVLMFILMIAALPKLIGVEYAGFSSGEYWLLIGSVVLFCAVVILGIIKKIVLAYNTIKELKNGASGDATDKATDSIGLRIFFNSLILVLYVVVVLIFLAIGLLNMRG